MNDTQGRFGAHAGAYHAFRPRWPREVYERILARVSASRAHAVDLGAGTGMIARELAERFERVTAVEPDERMLAQLEPRANLATRRARAEDARFEPGSVDLVTIGNAFHWMEGAAVCAHAFEWLRPGGALAVFRYNPPHAAAGALEALLGHEYEVVWREHVHARLRDPDYTRRTVAESSFGRTLETRWIPNDLSLALPELMGFLRSTSYGGGHARSLPDPEGYWSELEQRIREAAGPGPFVLDFKVELLIGVR